VLLGRTIEHLKSLLSSDDACTVTARAQFKKYLHSKSETLRICMAFYLTLFDFQQTNPSDPAFM
jgi:hypothetical protein